MKHLENWKWVARVEVGNSEIRIGIGTRTGRTLGTLEASDPFGRRVEVWLSAATCQALRNSLAVLQERLDAAPPPPPHAIRSALRDTTK